jgi:hypothetical protein
VPYGFVDPSLRREHDALTQFSLLGFLPPTERLGAEGVGNTHKTGKVPHDSSTTKVERSQSFYVDGGGGTGSVSCRLICVLHLSNFLNQEYFM